MIDQPAVHEEEKETQCTDCECDIIFDASMEVQRCEPCADHKHGICGPDCPIEGCLNATETYTVLLVEVRRHLAAGGLVGPAAVLIDGKIKQLLSRVGADQ